MYLQPIKDLCQGCKEKEAKYIVIEHDIGCCETCKNDVYRNKDAESITERSDIYKSINEAISLIKSIRPLAHILKVNFTEDELVFEDFLEHMVVEVKNCQEDMETASLSKIKDIYKKICTTINAVFDHQNL